ncbi:hypothetical protein N9L75_03770 [Porticoccaceae bacterium]|nr:hypothetical protein [Porticoccaceae bacterium]MDA8663436.1 hypothetical protein [Porticoccaceae bacterium]MDB2343095.1 hypothetical protein [Porticoccaceae bacterium]MDB2664390.1 hypothetical protein [Porticoccaceae bacterium]
MGAVIEIKHFSSCSIVELSKKIDFAINADIDEYGNRPYGGHWGEKQGEGFKVCPYTPLLGEDAAEEYIDEHSDRWGLLALRVCRVDDVAAKSFNKKIQQACIKRKSLEDTLHGKRSVRALALERIQAAKSQHRQCANCHSRLAVKYLKSANCPVCGELDFLLSKTDLLKLDKAAAKNIAITTEIESLHKKKLAKALSAASVDKPDTWFWLVGGWCSY